MDYVANIVDLCIHIHCICRPQWSGCRYITLKWKADEQQGIQWPSRPPTVIIYFVRNFVEFRMGGDVVTPRQFMSKKQIQQRCLHGIGILKSSEVQ